MSDYCTPLWQMKDAWYGIQQSAWRLHEFSKTRVDGEHTNSIFSCAWDERFEEELTGIVARVLYNYLEYLKHGREHHGHTV